MACIVGIVEAAIRILVAQYPQLEVCTCAFYVEAGYHACLLLIACPYDTCGLIQLTTCEDRSEVGIEVGSISLHDRTVGGTVATADEDTAILTYAYALEVILVSRISIETELDIQTASESSFAIGIENLLEVSIKGIESRVVDIRDVAGVCTIVISYTFIGISLHEISLTEART